MTNPCHGFSCSSGRARPTWIDGMAAVAVLLAVLTLYCVTDVLDYLFDSYRPNGDTGPSRLLSGRVPKTQEIP